MAKKNMIQREKKRKKLVKKYYTKRKKIKELLNQSKETPQKMDLQKQLQKLPRDSSASRLRNRCWLTGRSRGYYRFFGFSRHILREMSRECLLPGVTKSSW